MQMKDLVSAGSCAQSLGVKSVLYGGPGVGKTPLINTAPRPVLLAIEPGLLSMRGSNTPTFKAYDHPKGVAFGVDEFFAWFFGSNEVNNFDTLGVDSISEMAEAILRQELPQHKNKMQAYGNMSFRTMDILTKLYYTQNKNIVLIAKRFEDAETKRKTPSFPGQDLKVKVPHFFDEILHYSMVPIGTIPGVMQEVKAIQCHETYDIMARDRSGRLNQYEQPNLQQIFNKILSN